MVKVLLSRRLGELRITQAELSRMTGIRAATINNIYHNLSERICFEHLDLICEALDCDISEILVREPNMIIMTKSRRGKEKRSGL